VALNLKDNSKPKRSSSNVRKRVKS
jgi:hypothetical protein